MTTYEERKRQSQALFAESVCASAETTPVDFITVQGFAKQLCEVGTADFVPVEDHPYGLFGFCEDGVREKVRKDGGTIRFGWAIWEWPGVLQTGEFHAVWASPEGKLVDITPKPGGERRIAFVPDNTYPPDFNFDERPGNRRANAVSRVDKRTWARKACICSVVKGRACPCARPCGAWAISSVLLKQLPGRGDVMRAKLPDKEGFAERDGVRIHYEVYGNGRETMVFLAPWSIVHARVYKAQLPYFSERFRCITFDPRGNGQSDQPSRSPRSWRPGAARVSRPLKPL